MVEDLLKGASETVAIVGMDTHFGSWDGIDVFFHGVHDALYPDLRQNPAGDWVAPIEDFDLDLAAAGISPDEVDEVPPAQLLMVKTAVRALLDAGNCQETSPNGEAAVITVLGAGVASGAAISSAVATAFDLSGPALDLAEADFPLWKAFQTAVHLLASGQVDMVVLGAVSLLPGRSEIRPIPSSADRPTLSYDREMTRGFLGEGAAAVVLKTKSQAERDGDRIYAWVEAAATSQAAGQSPEGVAAACRDALTAASVLPEQVGYVEVSAAGMPSMDTAEIAGLHQVYSEPQAPLSCALGSASGTIGQAQAASSLAGVIKTALCIHHRVIPPVPGWHAPRVSSLWKQSPFYVPIDSRTWFVKSDPGVRAAGVNILSVDGASTHLILTGKETHEVRPNPLLVTEEFRLFPVAGQSLDEILSRLDELQGLQSAGASLKDLSTRCFRKYRAASEASLVLGLVAGQPEEFLREVEFARKGVSKAIERGTEWQTPLGSYFTPTPLGKLGSVAFVYPGAFNSFIGMGKDLFHLFPKIYPGFADVTEDMGQVLQERALYPRSLAALTAEESDSLETQLNENPVAMLTSGSGLAVMFTLVLREVFKVKPGAAFGYSLGESSMLFAQQVWSSGDAGSLNLAESPIFQNRLAGPKNAVRDAWGLPAGRGLPGNNGIWKNVLVMAPEEKVRTALQDEDRVYLTHINTPRQVVIAGDPAGCQRVVDRLQCPSLRAPFDHVLHCAPVRGEYQDLVRLNDHATHPPKNGVRLYSAAGYAPVQFDRESIARSIAETLCTYLDFPKLIHRVYADGARLFLELGAGSNCSKWIDETLKGEPHLAVSINRKGADDFTSIVRLLARLVSHRVPMDLSPLYPDQGDLAGSDTGLKKTILLTQI